MERDTQYNECMTENHMISTHTLTWSVTSVLEKIRVDLPISTHTLTWSVTVNNLIAQKIHSISTHTLTWSVTTL